MLMRVQHCTEAIYFKLNLYLNWQFHFEWEKEVPFVRWSEAEGTNFTPLKSKPTYLQQHNGVKAISKSYSNTCTITILQYTDWKIWKYYVKTKRDVIQNAKCVLEYSKVSVKIQTFFAIRKRGENRQFSPS